ncbi:unnamed protein product [Merluccius merluccius]
MSCLICGPKMAACGVVMSIWGVIMLALLGVFFRTHSAVLLEDVPLTEEDIIGDPNPPLKVYGIFNQVASNCFIAAAIYLVVGLFSFCQIKLNKRKEYLVQ